MQITLIRPSETSALRLDWWLFPFCVVGEEHSSLLFRVQVVDEDEREHALLEEVVPEVHHERVVPEELPGEPGGIWLISSMSGKWRLKLPE